MQQRRRQLAKSLDGQLPTVEQSQQLQKMIMDAFVAIRNCQDILVAKAIADAFHNLPIMMLSPDFCWSVQLMYFEVLESRYPAIGRHSIAAYDQILGFRS